MSTRRNRTAGDLYAAAAKAWGEHRKALNAFQEEQAAGDPLEGIAKELGIVQTEEQKEAEKVRRREHEERLQALKDEAAAWKKAAQAHEAEARETENGQPE